MTQPAHTIDEVIDHLTQIIDTSKQESSRLGYFPGLYRRVTIEVKRGIADGFFEDGPRMERLDVIFASRYLSAYEEFRAGGNPTACWAYAFEVAGQWWPIVLQHLLLGMNAHINLDLGIAVARTVPAEELPALKNDFDKINQVLASLVGDVQKQLAEIWPKLRWLNKHLGSVEDAIINFSLEKARDHAWSVANTLAPLPIEEQEEEIVRLDQEVRAFAELIRHPGFVGGVVTKLIRLGERGTVPDIIDILSGPTVEVGATSR